jgi:hypothetical protein
VQRGVIGPKDLSGSACYEWDERAAVKGSFRNLRHLQAAADEGLNGGATTKTTAASNCSQL